MSHSPVSTALAALAALSFTPASTLDASAQESPTRSWELALWMQAGYQHPMGRFASNSPSDLPELELLDAVAEFSGSQMLGGGVELALPDMGFNFRVGAEATTGAEATGYISICELVAGNVCREEVAPASMQGISFEVRSSRAGPRRRFAPVLALGLGLRWYDFSVPECTAGSGDEGRLTKLICDTITDLYRETKPNLLLRIGAGIRGHLAPLLVELAGTAGTGRYTGGAAKSEGRWHHELRANLSIGMIVF